MFHLEDRVRIQKGHSRVASMFYKTAMITSILLLFSYSIVLAEGTEKKEKEGIQDVHHVYMDGKHLGGISDRNLVNQVVEKKIAASEAEYENVNITIDEDISIITELAFHPTFTDDKVIHELESELTVKAEAVQLKVEDEHVGYFTNEADAKAVIKKYKLNYVDEEVLDWLEEQTSSSESEVDDRLDTAETNENTSSLAIGDSEIVDVYLSKDVSFSDEKIHPENILSIEDGLKLLEKGTLTEEKHSIEEGEVLVEIADKYDLTLDELLELNPSISEDSLLQIDQELHVTALQPFVDVIVVKESKEEETIEYETEIIETDDLYKGDETVRQNGSDGKKEVHYQVELINGQVVNREVLDENITKEAVDEVIVKGTKVISSRGTGEFQWPAIGGYVTSAVGPRWGRMHKGIDIARPSNRAIIASDNGTVAQAGYAAGLGNRIVINHNNGYKTVYGHLSSIQVEVGQTVEKGTTIGIMGSTGNSTGVHLHFELYKNGALQNPLQYIK